MAPKTYNNNIILMWVITSQNNQNGHYDNKLHLQHAILVTAIYLTYSPTKRYHLLL